MKYFFTASFFLFKYYYFKIFIKQKKTYTLDNIQQPFSTPAGVLSLKSLSLVKPGMRYKINVYPKKDLLAQYRYLGIGGALFVVSDPNVLAPPTQDNLGIASHLYFLAN